ncbi:PucR family transcriptional regulator [Pseudonocardia oroxyli]|uniref:PucR C-terminal helix-turn-helix domain-containing protein n=1 Tax=Pseudonocardia oroxyli TaxID=366584 RepID=A0A1G7I9R9_PSEOR|nr:helix-turn-helix domain-containing protein [Pseudonocardia oroxyli]SDF09224.1 PucR C-terminal helix-turn-helix domain-containing protein [Pseudonocardia oroxyli]
MDSAPVTPDRLVEALLGRVPAVMREVGAALLPEWPDYARFLDTNRDEVAAAAVHVVHRLVGPEAAEGIGIGEQELFEEIGRMQWREGRDVSSLLSAFQLGARVFWRHVAEVAVALDLGPRPLATLAEGVFAFVDRLSSSAAHGFVLEQSEAAVARERLREELVDLLLSDRATEAAVAAAAVRAQWQVPEQVAVVLVQDDSLLGHGVLSRFDPGTLLINRVRLPGAIVPDPAQGGRRQRLADLLRGTRAVVGPTVPPDRLPASLHIAEVAARLQRSGVLPEDPVFAEEHLDAIIVHRDARLLEVLRAQVLRPLEGAAPASRERLCETLVSWLRHLGDRQAMAAELHVHPQTVRYRLARLYELFGPGLDDPDLRARLLLALAWGAPRLPGVDPNR